MAASLQFWQCINLVFIMFLAAYNGVIVSWMLLAALASFAYFIDRMWRRRIGTQHVEAWWEGCSAVTTSLGVVLMVYLASWWIYVAVVGIALAQKHLLTPWGRHLFNPSNAALIAALVLWPQHTYIRIGQLGYDLFIVVTVVAIGAVVLQRARRWIIPPVFAISYLLFSCMWYVAFDPELTCERFVLRFWSVSFIVFMLFMLTDPKTTPSRYGYQALFAFAVAALAVGLDVYFGWRIQHPFEALFVLTPVVVWLQRKKDRRQVIGNIAVWLLLMAALLLYLHTFPSKVAGYPW